MEQMNGKVLPEILDTHTQEETFSPEAQLIYILQGEMSLEIYEKPFELKAEDVVIVNANERYRYKATGDILFCPVAHSSSGKYGESQAVSHRFLCNSLVDDRKNYDELRRVFEKSPHQRPSCAGTCRPCDLRLYVLLL